MYHYFIIIYANNKKTSFLILITKMQNLLEHVVLSILESQQALLKCLPFEIGRVWLQTLQPELEINPLPVIPETDTK